MAKVELKGIGKIYDGNVRAVENANITIEDQEFVVFVGPSGCGKSTTLRMVAGLEEITEGNLYIDGERMNDVPPKDRNIAMVFQNYALYPHMTVYDNMAFGLKIRKVDKQEIERRVHEAARILDIEKLLDRKPKALSGGQRQRVAVGRAIVRNPKVFLFDEPLSNLDAKLRVQMRAEISDLHHRLKATMIYVTHDQVEAMTMGDKIVVMKDGKVHQIGSPLYLYNHPINKFVAGFIGSPPMNFLSVTVIEDNGAIKVDEGSFILEPTEEHQKHLKRYVGKQVFFGIRPEDMELSQKASEKKRNAA
ncbi:ABC transporter ATP-binding protein [Treponema phagedenis]|uniref:ABC transporter ATP-binding protein n=1 Tax=Treponema phagedenis TaxID=162 RepID=UPI002090737E|nr:sn-glycerol-3-phosphate ABC transporter ATP-binding protein UgpC [Treponema phagedenis]